MERTLLNRLHEWAWSLLPDNCEADECRREGVRGNENVITKGDEKFVLCDGCSTRYSYYRRVIVVSRDKKTFYFSTRTEHAVAI